MQSNACAVSERPTDVDCPHFCGDVDSLHQRAQSEAQVDCGSLWQAHLDCWKSNASETCNAEFSGCAESGTAWTDCMSAYCAAMASQSKIDPNCYKGEITLSPF